MVTEKEDWESDVLMYTKAMIDEILAKQAEEAYIKGFEDSCLKDARRYAELKQKYGVKG